MIDRIACGGANLVGPRTDSIIPLSKIRTRAFSLRSVGRRCVGLRGGSASALLGLCQFVFGAAAAPLVGIAGTGTAVPMAVVIAASAALAALLYRALSASRRIPPPWYPPEPPPPSPA
jgi:hypothetical protein